ncbi:MAG: glutamine--tRNA ligase [Flavobacteriales bacterium]|nr:glutamine--tRNA ligase [Flavobacteriales bacterium]
MEEERSLNFIEQIIEQDLASGKHTEIYTRFPPEPNGYLHIGHAKAICLNFGLGEQYNGKVNLRFDDTNPSAEKQEYVDAIKENIKWLGFKWEKELHTSDHFQQLYEYAVQLINQGDAYVCEQSAEEMAKSKGTPTEPGQNSPFRDRCVEENLELFEKMKNGEVDEGAMTLRAKIDMAHSNMHMRDPLMYRIINERHHRTGSDWVIYPIYDFAHGVSDAIEGITHSICTLEFEVHRPLYEWFNNKINTPAKPQQIEMARLNISNAVTSKRKVKKLIDEGVVFGWDDPRLTTLAGIRRRGVPAQAIRDLAEGIGVSKRNSITEMSRLDYYTRQVLNKTANRVMAVLDPLKVTITNFDEGKVEMCEAKNNPEDESAGTRDMPISRNLYIEKADFMEDAPKKFFRLTNGKEVRFKHGYYITCNEVLKDAQGNITELLCTYDPTTKGGWSDDGRKIKGTIHWVSAEHALKAKVNLYEGLFNSENPEEGGKDFMEDVNPNSLEVIEAFVEPSVKDLAPGTTVQFDRTGYFCVDKDSTPNNIIFNRTVTLRDKKK